jgi:hypothetical protein
MPMREAGPADVTTLVGLLRDFCAEAGYELVESRAAAAFLLGMLLLVIGSAGLAVAGTQIVTLDSAYWRIVEDRTLLGAKTAR